MNKIAIVGHPASGYEEVLALLEQSGMAPARPSRREGLLPQDINAALMTAHKAPPVSAVLDEDGFSPIETGPVWHGMALDLMLGNLDEPLWGWADPQAIYALHYWKDLDPQLTFVLVYDEPHRVLLEAARKQGGPPSGEDLGRLLDNWIAYNGALLRFHLRHPGRSLLVNAQQARRAAGIYLQQLQPLLDAPLSLPDVDSDGDVVTAPLRISGASLLPVVSQAVAVAGAEPQQAAAVLTAGAAERYLVDGVLANHRRALQLYAELQSAASLPLDRHAVAAGNAAAAWETLVTQRNFVADLLAQIHAKYQGANEELSQIRNRLDDARTTQARESERLSEQLRELKQALDAEKRASADFDRKLKETNAENELLLNQLHHVQEELERVFERKQALEQRLKNAAERLKNASQRLKDADRRLGDAAREVELVKQHISYRLGQVLLRHGRTLWGWLILPFALLREVRAYRKQRTATQ